VSGGAAARRNVATPRRSKIQTKTRAAKSEKRKAEKPAAGGAAHLEPRKAQQRDRALLFGEIRRLLKRGLRRAHIGERGAVQAVLVIPEEGEGGSCFTSCVSFAHRVERG
jgi:hypothetical protein